MVMYIRHSKLRSIYLEEGHRVRREMQAQCLVEVVIGCALGATPGAVRQMGANIGGKVRVRHVVQHRQHMRITAAQRPRNWTRLAMLAVQHQFRSWWEDGFCSR